MGYQLLLQLILILLNAFFAATEIAVISLNEKKVKSRAENGDKKAVKMLRMIEDPTSFLSTIQIGITLAGFLGSAFAADNFSGQLADWLISKFDIAPTYFTTIEDISVIAITLVLSFFTLVLGELVPKRIAMKHKEKLAEYVCGFISGMTFILTPIVWFLRISTNGVLRIFGVDPNEKEETVSEEDIVIMLDAGADEGTFDEEDIEYIKNVFKLERLTAVDVMTPRKSVVFISEDETREEIIEKIESEGYSRIPIYGENPDEITGILYVRDYLLKFNKPDFKLADAIFEPVFVPETMKLDQLFKNMQEDRNHIVIVVNEFGVPSGIVTMEDILEELVGEIWDERDEAIDNITELGDDTYKVLCSTSTEDFFSYFEVTPDEESEAATVNGWLTEKVGDIPEIGYVLEYENITVTVTQADNIMATEVSVKINKTEADEDAEEE